MTNTLLALTARQQEALGGMIEIGFGFAVLAVVAFCLCKIFEGGD